MSADTPSYDAFTSHQGPGFTLDLPAGWSVKHDERDLIMVEREGARLNIWPMLVHAPLGAHAAALLQAIAEQLRDDMTWNAPRRLADHVWTLDGEGQEAGFARLVLGASTPQGQPLWLYLATAPDAAHLAALTPLAERVFRSYRPRAPQDTEQGAGAEAPVPATSSAVSAAEAATGETPFVEPTEQAFAITVPTGWEAQAGVVRYGVSATPWIRLRAADGAEIRLFDPRLPTSHHEPGPATQFIGRAVGSVLNGVMVRPYTPPSAFAAEYATAMAQELGASGVTVTEHLGQEETVAAWSPAFRQAVEAEWARGIERLQRLIPHVQSQPDYGAVSFVCTGGPGDLAGLFYILGSRLTMPDGMGGTMYVWSAHPFGFIGPAVRRDALVRTLHEIGASKQMNPQWEQRQEHLARQRIQQQ
ncbi:MAG: hypothetical protein HKN04_13240, partial [Rhodothermaceae bacterium]|nr:hypothetical protein [Rhodothermaceae bacterium]